MARHKSTQTPLTNGASFVLADRLQRARVDAGLSQQQLADRAGVSLGSVARLETKRSPEPGFFLIGSVVRVLGAALSEPERRALWADIRVAFLGHDVPR
ncbi:MULTISPECIES: helix-turn-helix domain-containing protein [unclassified Frondihabitans]|uniref:helix-turn-helix domain-containing protein n=1 Tax=unclassified Frondihabitans TaxID=2626248 RepID=UPI000FB2F2A7|nr:MULTISPECIES: helix-turn-helix transcriptional regulator [unclassified Frondihabitans]RPE77891.1 helix-turn-helix protein [Frondihabitans sp. PhB153]RPF08171.1 helix-turn-helix protein [Frondihabitans sp. PhB161]